MEDNNGMNPIAAALASKNASEAQPTGNQEQSPGAAEAPAAQTEGSGEQAQQANPQSEEANTHIESNSQQQTEESQREQEAKALENVEDSNASQAQEGGNTESQAASETEEDEKPFWEQEDSNIFSEQEQISDLPEGDYSAIGKAIGLENASANDVLGKITEISTQNKELSEKVKNYEENSQFATPELAEANEVARNGGDYKTLLGLSQNDWDGVPDNVLLVEGKLKGAFGEDEEGMLKYLNEMDPMQVKMQAAEIRQSLKENDEYQKQQIVQKAQERRKKTDDGIRKALDGVSNAYGINVTAAMKREMYQNLTGGAFVESIFHDKEGNPDPKKMVDAAIKLGNFNKIVKTAITTSRNAATGEILDSVTNQDVNRQGQMVDPTPKKELSPLERRMASLQGGQK